MLKLYSHLNHIRVRGKSIILITFMAISFLAVVTIVNTHITKLEQAGAQKKQLDQTSILINKLAFNTFEIHLFMTKMLNGDNNTSNKTSYIDYKISTIKKNIATLQTILDQSNKITALQETNQPIHTIEILLSDLQKNYLTAIQLKEQIGHNEDEGIQGRLRTHIHTLEKELTAIKASNSLVTLLQLRRCEKDFIMRGHQESLTLFIQAIQTMHDMLFTSQTSAIKNNKSHQEIFEHYQQEALKLQENLPKLMTHQKQLLTINNAILRNATILTNKNQKLMLYNTNNQETTLQYTGLSLILSLSITFLLLGWVSYLFFQSLLIPIQLLSRYANKISKGEYKLKISLYGTDEIGELAASLQAMKESLLSQQKFLEDQVKRRTQHLEITNAVLNDTISQLNATHKELLHSEKRHH